MKYGLARKSMAWVACQHIPVTLPLGYGAIPFPQSVEHMVEEATNKFLTKIGPDYSNSLNTAATTLNEIYERNKGDGRSHSGLGRLGALDAQWRRLREATKVFSLSKQEVDTAIKTFFFDSSSRKAFCMPESDYPWVNEFLVHFSPPREPTLDDTSRVKIVAATFGRKAEIATVELHVARAGREDFVVGPLVVVEKDHNPPEGVEPLRFTTVLPDKPTNMEIEVTSPPEPGLEFSEQRLFVITKSLSTEEDPTYNPWSHVQPVVRSVEEGGSRVGDWTFKSYRDTATVKAINGLCGDDKIAEDFRTYHVELWKNYYHAVEMRRLLREQEPEKRIRTELILLDLARFGLAPVSSIPMVCNPVPKNEIDQVEDQYDSWYFRNNLHCYAVDFISKPTCGKNSDERPTEEFYCYTPQWKVTQFMKSPEFTKLQRKRLLKAVFDPQMADADKGTVLHEFVNKPWDDESTLRLEETVKEYSNEIGNDAFWSTMVVCFVDMATSNPRLIQTWDPFWSLRSLLWSAIATPAHIVIKTPNKSWMEALEMPGKISTEKRYDDLIKKINRAYEARVQFGVEMIERVRKARGAEQSTLTDYKPEFVTVRPPHAGAGLYYNESNSFCGRFVIRFPNKQVRDTVFTTLKSNRTKFDGLVNSMFTSTVGDYEKLKDVDFKCDNSRGELPLVYTQGAKEVLILVVKNVDEMLSTSSEAKTLDKFVSSLRSFCPPFQRPNWRMSMRINDPDESLKLPLLKEGTLMSAEWWVGASPGVFNDGMSASEASAQLVLPAPVQLSTRQSVINAESLGIDATPFEQLRVANDIASIKEDALEFISSLHKALQQSNDHIQGVFTNEVGLKLNVFESLGRIPHIVLYNLSRGPPEVVAAYPSRPLEPLYERGTVSAFMIGDWNDTERSKDIDYITKTMSFRHENCGADWNKKRNAWYRKAFSMDIKLRRLQDAALFPPLQHYEMYYFHRFDPLVTPTTTVAPPSDTCTRDDLTAKILIDNSDLFRMILYRIHSCSRKLERLVAEKNLRGNFCDYTDRFNLERSSRALESFFDNAMARVRGVLCDKSLYKRDADDLNYCSFLSIKSTNMSDAKATAEAYGSLAFLHWKTAYASALSAQMAILVSPTDKLTDSMQGRPLAPAPPANDGEFEDKELPHAREALKQPKRKADEDAGQLLLFRTLERLSHHFRDVWEFALYLQEAVKRNEKKNKNANTASIALQQAVDWALKTQRAFVQLHGVYRRAMRSYADMASAGILDAPDLRAKLSATLTHIQHFKDNTRMGFAAVLLHLSSRLERDNTGSASSRNLRKLKDRFQVFFNIVHSTDLTMPDDIGSEEWWNGYKAYSQLVARAQTNALLGSKIAAATTAAATAMAATAAPAEATAAAAMAAETAELGTTLDVVEITDMEC